MIDKWLNKVDHFDPAVFFWWIVGFSILLAAWMQTIQHGWINPDSVLYFEQAKLFAIGQWATGFDLFKWPLYGIAIGFIHKLTLLPIQMSAQLLNMLFFGMATASFLLLIKLAGGNNRTWLMGILLLFSSQYIVGDILEMLMRDEGFWAFYLTALVFFIRYIKQHQVRDALLWQLCIIIATLFRIEAILYLLLLPLTYLLIHEKFSIRFFQHLVSTYSISLFVGILIAIVLFTQPQLSISSFGRLDEIFTSDLYQQFTKKLFTQADIMSNQVLGNYLDEFAVPGLLLTFIYIIGSKILTSTGLVGTGLAFCSLKKTHQAIHSSVKQVLLIAGCIALLAASLIIIKVFVLSSRYVVALAWVLLVFASFYLTTLSYNTRKKPRIIFLTICLVLCLGFIKNILPKRDGYNYSQEAVAWVQSNNQNNELVFYNESRMRYYAKEAFIGGSANKLKTLSNAIKAQNFDQYRYLLISTSKKEAEKLKSITDEIPQYKLIKTFKNYKQKKFVLVFKRN